MGWHKGVVTPALLGRYTDNKIQCAKCGDQINEGSPVWSKNTHRRVKRGSTIHYHENGHDSLWL